ncbi:TPA: hypothetical protein DCW38_02385 [candidate division WOR-3 bacterium]|jgi:hypothetical protein|uniref:Uncharacterized protein n=1 Tax=candidate division WOR-3 bacterium TaxID=2052148 RepID=A0A350H8Z5_UNCW3|nr:hypothetical protein [candidate division WOR-3 bacterium]
MKKTILLFAVAALIAGCSLNPFYTDKNNIMDYIPEITDGDIYTYSHHTYSLVERFDDSTQVWVTDTTDTAVEMTDTCREVEVSDEKAYYLFNHSAGLIFIKDRGIAAITDDSLYTEDEDFDFLKTPVQVESDWIFDSMKVEIKKMGETYEKNEIKVEDVIVIEIAYDIDALGDVYRLYYSPSVGIVKEYQVINDDGDIYSYTKELIRISEAAE